MTNLFDDDQFLTTYPTYKAYRAEWDRSGGAEVAGVPDSTVLEFYASHLDVVEALHIWLTYDPVTQHYKIAEAISSCSNI